jgi:predicted MPP superfamily phosphohydrolase
VVLADGRHPVILKSIDPSRRTVTFDLIQMYWGDEATREAAKDHQESPPPNDYYIRNVNPKLRTLPVRADAPITINTIATWTGSATKNVSVTLDRIASLDTDGAVFYLTVRHDQVVKIAQQYLP